MNGSKTIVEPDGTRRHVPLTDEEAEKLWQHVLERKRKRAELMPDERAAIDMMFMAWQRLKELGWNDIVYSPKDGSEFDVIEPGSTGIFTCTYLGDWPSGSWWIHDNGDSYPSHPILFKLRPGAEIQIVETRMELSFTHKDAGGFKISWAPSEVLAVGETARATIQRIS